MLLTFCGKELPSRSCSSSRKLQVSVPRWVSGMSGWPHIHKPSCCLGCDQSGERDGRVLARATADHLSDPLSQRGSPASCPFL